MFETQIGSRVPQRINDFSHVPVKIETVITMCVKTNNKPKHLFYQLKLFEIQRLFRGQMPERVMRLENYTDGETGERRKAHYMYVGEYFISSASSSKLCQSNRMGIFAISVILMKSFYIN
jgi:hypothetical protein